MAFSSWFHMRMQQTVKTQRKFDGSIKTAAHFIDSIILILLLNWMVYVVGVCQRQNINTPASAEHH